MTRGRILTEDDLGLPKRAPFEPRVVSEHYGAGDIAAAYCGISGSYPTINGQWTHGWVPSWEAGDPEGCREYLAFHNIRRGREDFWCPGPEAVPHIQAFGWTARAIGMPIVYLPERHIERVPGSLLVMPLHSLEDEKHNWTGETFADAVSRVRHHFSEIVVSVYASCMESGFWVNAFLERGFSVIKGAHWADRNSLERVRTLLSRFEFVTTNGFGSHLAYGSYFGAKVSVCGEFIEPKVEDMKHDQICLSGDRFMRRIGEHRSQKSLRNHCPFFFCEPQEAQTQVDWARREVGHDYKVSSATLRELFHWRESELLRWRLYGRPAAGLRRLAQRWLPAGLKHAVKATFSADYRARHREEERLRREAGWI